MRLTTIPTTTSDPAVAPLYTAIRGALGIVPNLMQTIATSPAALEGYLGLNAALAKGRLPAAVRERLALAIAQDNACDYCLAAHTLLGGRAGLTPDEVQRARQGTASEPYAAAAVALARAVNRQAGKVADAEVAAARSGGLDDGAIIEVIAHVALNRLTNAVNNLAQTTIDFPPAPALAARQA